MSSNIELVQIVLKVDGDLCQVLIPDNAKSLLVGMLPGFFPDKKIAVRKLPSDFRMVRLADLETQP